MGVLTRLLLSFVSGMSCVSLKEASLIYCPQHNTGYHQPRFKCQNESIWTWYLLNTTRNIPSFTPVPFPVSLSALTTAISSGRPEGDHTIVWHSHQHNSFSPSFSITQWLKSQRSGKKKQAGRCQFWEAKPGILIPKHRFSWILISVGMSWAGKKLRMGI